LPLFEAFFFFFLRFLPPPIDRRFNYNNSLDMLLMDATADDNEGPSGSSSVSSGPGKGWWSWWSWWSWCWLSLWYGSMVLQQHCQRNLNGRGFS
jgi:hypothetical protein